MILRSPSMIDLADTLAALARARVSVLLLGETGVGKTALIDHTARVARTGAPFECINAAALPPELAASALFGHERGAFTGARERRIGALERAGAGTILLDEVADLDPSTQGALLHALERRPYRRVGGSIDLIVEAWIVSATSRPIDSLRPDLVRRLAPVALTVPPLRDRPEDLEALIDRFTRGRPVTKAARLRLTRERWPFNVGGLRSCLEVACALSSGDRVELADVDRALALKGASRKRPTLGEATRARLHVLPSLELLGRPWSRVEYAARAGLSPRSADRDLAALAEAGLIERRPGRRWACMARPLLEGGAEVIDLDAHRRARK